MRKNRFLSILLTLALLLTLLPGMSMSMTAYADGDVAQVGGVGYNTLAAAIDAVSDGGTVTLLQDVTLTEPLRMNKSYTLDFNNCAISYNTTATTTISGASTIIFKNGKLDISGAHMPGTSAGNDIFSFNADGNTLTFDKMKLFGEGYGGYSVFWFKGNDTTPVNTLNFENGSIIELKDEACSSGGVIKGPGAYNDNKLFVVNFVDSTVSCTNVYRFSLYGTINVTNSTVTFTGGENAFRQGIFTFDHATVNVSGAAANEGKAISPRCADTKIKNNSTLTLTGSNIGKDVCFEYPYNIEVDQTSTLTVSAVYGSANDRKIITPEGYALLTTKNADNTTTYRSGYIAMIGDTGYASLAKAVEAANAGDTITLLADDNVSLTSGDEIVIDKALTITGPVDDNGVPLYTVYGTPDQTGTNYISISGSGTVTIENVKIKQFGKNANTDASHAPIYVNQSFTGTVNLKNVHVSEFNRGGIFLYGGTFSVEGCDIDCANSKAGAFTKGIEIKGNANGKISDTTICNMERPGDYSVAGIELYGSGSIEVTNCEIVSDIGQHSSVRPTFGIVASRVGAHDPSDGKLTVTSSKIDVTGGCVSIADDEEYGSVANYSMTIEDCIFTNYIALFSESLITLESGSFKEDVYAGAGEIVINGGTFTNFRPETAATGIITINSGTFNLSGNSCDFDTLELYCAIDLYPFPGDENVYTVEPYVTITFNANNGDQSQRDVEQYVKIGVASQLAENNFTNGVRVFVEWNTDAGGAGTSYSDKAEVTLNEDITLFARWESIPAVITANDLTYDGTDQPLISVSGGPSEGDLYFALGADASTAPTEDTWSGTIPTGRAAGTYYVWYKVVKGTDTSVRPTFLAEVTIAKKSAAFLTITPDQTVFHYDMQVHVPTITVKDGENLLTAPTDYAIKYFKKNTANASWEVIDEQAIFETGTYKAVLTFVNYEAGDGGEVAVEFVITRPEYVGHSLVLSGYIGVNFYLRLPEYPGFSYGGSTMTFTVNGEEETVSLAEAVRVDGLYRFTCYVTSIQMADEIKAVFTYKWNNDENESKETYTVKQYITDSEMLELDAKTRNLIHALADYGHYIQPFLAEQNDWVIDTHHKAMNKFFTTYPDSAAVTVMNKLASKSISVKRSSKIAKVTYNLLLDSGTTLNLFFAPVKGYKGGATATVNGVAVPVDEDDDGRFVVSIDDIPAYRLGTACTVVLKTAGVSTTVKVSAMSYVKAALANADETTKAALLSLYYYYAAAVAYKG